LFEEKYPEGKPVTRDEIIIITETTTTTTTTTTMLLISGRQ
jgi:hypothetical protein